MSETYFNEVADYAIKQVLAGEVLLVSLEGETSNFVRFNSGAIRQAGSIRQQSVVITLIVGSRQTSGVLQLATDRELDDARLSRLISQLREQLRYVSEDPYIAYNQSSDSSSDVSFATLPEVGEVLGAVGEAGQGRDMVGIYAAGDSFGGFASSLGQRDWYQRSTFNLDWSFYLRADKAAKSGYAGKTWSDAAFSQKVEEAAGHLVALEREPIMLKPGSYRSFLTPSAVNEMMGLLSWDSFGLQAYETKQTALLRMVTEGMVLSPDINISEATGAGVSPAFSDLGFSRPDTVELIAQGEHAGTLVSARSSLQYGVDTNGANSAEHPESLAIKAGRLPVSDVLAQLGTGIYVGNLWYTNYSDRTSCRQTGLTRFATFWVEGGEIVAPIGVMRFDDSIYSLLGTELVGLTDETEMILDPSSYGQRSTGSSDLPGALVNEMKFTL